MARELPKSNPQPSHDQIAQRAYEIFVEHGRPEGRDIEHWLEAEAQLKQQQPHAASVARSAGTSIRPQPRRPF